MGQYYKVVNLDKGQYLHPHRFDDGLKLMEFGCSRMGTLTALTVLLADGNGAGGGDLRSNDPLVGSWAGDRIVIAGDYADKGSYSPHDDEECLYVAAEGFEDVSARIIKVLSDAGEDIRHD